MHFSTIIIINRTTAVRRVLRFGGQGMVELEQQISNIVLHRQAQAAVQRVVRD